MNTQVTHFIRQAESSDAESLAKLINLAGEGIPKWLWTRACVEGQTPLEIGIERAKRKTGGFSYANALVAAPPLGGGGSNLLCSAPLAAHRTRQAARAGS